MAAQSKPALLASMLQHALLSRASSSALRRNPRAFVRRLVADLSALYLKNRTRVSRAVYLVLLVALVNRVRLAVAEQRAAAERRQQQHRRKDVGTTVEAKTPETADGKKKRKKVELDREFFKSLIRLLRIVVPGWRSEEMRMLISHSFFLVVRTLISLKVAAMDGAIVKSLVKGNGREFLTRIVWWMLIAVPATFTNSMVSSVVRATKLRRPSRC